MNTPVGVDAPRTATGRGVLASCGAPSTLFVANSDGTAQREVLRCFLPNSLSLAAKIMKDEFSLKLDTEIRLDLSAIHAADTAGRSREFPRLAKAGAHLGEATMNTGVVSSKPVRVPIRSATSGE